MPGMFQPRCSRAPVDDRSIRIVVSRMQGPLPDGSDPAQFEFVLYRGVETFGHLGLHGGSSTLEHR